MQVASSEMTLFDCNYHVREVNFCFVKQIQDKPEKTADISQCHHNNAEKFLTEDVSLPSAFDWVKFASSNEKHYADQRGDVSSAWNLLAPSSDVIFAEKPVLAS